MALTVLSESDSLKVGASIWVADTEKGRGRWSSRLDWLLNFQFEKWKQHVTPQIAPELRQVLADEELDISPPPSTRNGHVLISSAEILPTSQVLFFSRTNEKTLTEWIASGLEVLDGLKPHSVRFFLAEDLDSKTENELKRKFQNSKIAVELVKPHVRSVPREPLTLGRTGKLAAHAPPKL